MPLPTSLVVKNGSKILSGNEIPLPLSENETSTALPARVRSDLDARWTPYLVNRVVGVVQNVQKNLLQLVSIAHHFRKAFVEMFNDVHAVAIEIVGAQLNRATQDGVQLHSRCAAAAFGAQS